jgi:hypothetical protein
MTATRLRIVSFGGGVQSTCLLVLAAEGRIDYRTFVFANVGNDSEHPDTLRYIRDVAAPYAKRHGIELVQLDRIRRDGSLETLYGRLTKPGSRSLPIPVRMSNGKPGRRSCSVDFKIRVIGKWLKANGANASNPAIVGIGISLDEIWRLNRRRVEPYEQPVYPLLEYDPPLRRADCETIIRAAGLPVPGKSACWFCPMKRPATWAEMRRDRPELFDRAAALEELLNQRRAHLGRDPVWLTRFNKPISEAVPAAQEPLPLLDIDPQPGGEGCDNGVCFT